MATSTIHTVTDGGRVHIAFNEQYSGSINSYNNFFTRFFAWAFRWSEKVTINGKVRHLDKKSYSEWAWQNTRDQTTSPAFHTLKFTPQNYGLMRSYLSQRKTVRLFEKMVTSMTRNGDFQKAARYVGKGAQVDGSFWLRERFGISYTTLKEGLPQSSFTIEAGYYTPFLYAATCNQKNFCQLLKEYQAYPEATVGQKVKLSRQIADITTNTQVQPTFGQSFGHDNSRSHVGIQVRTSTTVHMRDELTKLETLRYNKETDSVEHVASHEPIVIENYSYVRDANTVPLGSVSIGRDPCDNRIRVRPYVGLATS